MIHIDNTIIYRYGKYQYKNFILLSEEEKLTVLEWRNHIDIRKWMINNEPIKLENHLNFIDSLNNREDCFYWLVFMNNSAIGVVSVTNINYQNSSCQSGFYLNPEIINKGEGFYFTLNFSKLMFEVFDLKCLYGDVLKSNKFALMHSLFLGTNIVKEIELNGNTFFETYLTKDDFMKDIDEKSDINNFAKFVYNSKKKSF